MANETSPEENIAIDQITIMMMEAHQKGTDWRRIATELVTDTLPSLGYVLE